MAVISIAIVSFILRVWHLATPQGYVFDEVYYVNGARDLLRYGVEVKGGSPEFVVHPPVGKWCIGFGIKIFGNNEFGWRISSAVVGSITIVLIARIALRLFGSRRFSTLAAGLMALDGLHLVHSRTALLDLFLTFFLLLSALSWLKANYWRTGIWFGLALGTKWSAIYFLVVFALAIVYKERDYFSKNLKKLIRPLAQFGLLPFVTYLFTWSGWLLSSRGWDRQFSPGNPLLSLWHYHAEMLNFHTRLVAKHSYQANPWSWLVMGRPTSFFYSSPKTCGASSCAQEVLALGTPLLWWLGTLAIFTVFGFWIASMVNKKVDAVAGFILLGITSGYLPWFFFQKRTVFSFYAIAFEPFLILALVYCVHKFLGPKPWSPPRKRIIAILISAIAINFFYFLPLFNATVTTYSFWQQHMWWQSWI